MDTNKTGVEISQLRCDIRLLEEKLLKLQAEINIKKIQLGRDIELLEIKGIEVE